MSILPLALVAGLLFFFLCMNEFRVWCRVKRASERLERGKARGGFIYRPGKRLS